MRNAILSFMFLSFAVFGLSLKVEIESLKKTALQQPSVRSVPNTVNDAPLFPVDVAVISASPELDSTSTQKLVSERADAERKNPDMLNESVDVDSFRISSGVMEPRSIGEFVSTESLEIYVKRQREPRRLGKSLNADFVD